MMAEELNCTVTEAKMRLTPQEFADKLTFWETHPPMYDHINTCTANIAYTIAATNRGKGRLVPFDKFLIDYKKAQLPSRVGVDTKLRKLLGGAAANKKGS